MTLARMEGRIAIERFLRRFPRYEILKGRTAGGRIRFHGLTHLPANLRST
jgi:cytochrome P450